jgi:hypothetical protein
MCLYDGFRSLSDSPLLRFVDFVMRIRRKVEVASRGAGEQKGDQHRTNNEEDLLHRLNCTAAKWTLKAGCTLCADLGTLKIPAERIF